ncbi:ATP-dependent helicase [Clostridium sp. JS66]|uniref:ATP-dependent helicase n=1 Tax=Clostridium sp. JS66 TaxID=3064705 RepID=UPI00298DAB11|nr:ATP-dependent helicase [Clostridium sp. JS66]WPC42387.1 ATP-dependent helicase [Clostridium sp. JS66]
MQPNKLQSEIINYISDVKNKKRILLVEAPPGTGKTYTAILSAVSFLKNRNDLENKKILILTFSKNAKAQLDKQLDDTNESKDICDRIEILNFHSFFQRYVWAYSCFLGLGNNLIIVSPNERKKLIKERINFIDWDKFGEKHWKKEATLIDWIDNILENYSNLDSYTGTGVIKEYFKYKEKIKDSIININKDGYMAFSDIAFYMNVLINKSPALLKVIQNKYPLIILDEYQDSSELQNTIVKKIIGRKNNAMFFADSKQMIYDWRGASENRLYEVKDFYSGEIEEKKLEENMRFKGSQQMRTFLSDIREGKHCEIVNSPELSLCKFKVKKVQYYQQQESLVKNSIYYSVLNKLKLDMKDNKNKDSSIGILCRKNELVSYLRKHLREEVNIWTKDISNNEEEHNMVGEFCSFQKFINNSVKNDDFNDNYCRYIFKFIFYVLYQDKIASFKRNLIKEINFDKIKKAKSPIIKSFRIEMFKAIEQEKYFDGLKNVLKVITGTELAGNVNKDIYRLLINIMLLKNINYENITKIFLQYQHKRAYKVLNGIYVLTMHQSKGREFNTVYVINEPKMNISDNVFYVAVTRTKEKLCIFQNE